jgi:hypothetical protein
MLARGRNRYALSPHLYRASAFGSPIDDTVAMRLLVADAHPNGFLTRNTREA